MGPLLLYVPVQLLPDCTLSLSDQSPSPTRARSGRPPDSAKRAAIIDAAGARFFELGFAATSIEQIAQDAGVSKVTVYKHFGDKDALFAAAVQRECENMRGVLAIEDLHAGSLRERLTAIGEEMLGFLSRSKMVQFERRIAAETEQNPALGKAFMESGPYAMLDAFTALLDEMARWVRLFHILFWAGQVRPARADEGASHSRRCAAPPAARPRHVRGHAPRRLPLGAAHGPRPLAAVRAGAPDARRVRAAPRVLALRPSTESSQECIWRSSGRYYLAGACFFVFLY